MEPYEIIEILKDYNVEYFEYFSNSLEKLEIDFSNVCFLKFGFHAFSRVSTVKGIATILGIFNKRLWVLVDDEFGACCWNDIVDEDTCLKIGGFKLLKEDKTWNKKISVALQRQLEKIMNLAESINNKKYDDSTEFLTEKNSPLHSPMINSTKIPGIILNNDENGFLSLKRGESILMNDSMSIDRDYFCNDCKGRCFGKSKIMHISKFDEGVVAICPFCDTEYPSKLLIRHIKLVCQSDIKDTILEEDFGIFPQTMTESNIKLSESINFYNFDHSRYPVDVHKFDYDRFCNFRNKSGINEKYLGIDKKSLLYLCEKQLILQLKRCDDNTILKTFAHISSLNCSPEIIYHYTEYLVEHLDFFMELKDFDVILPVKIREGIIISNLHRSNCFRCIHEILYMYNKYGSEMSNLKSLIEEKLFSLDNIIMYYFYSNSRLTQMEFLAEQCLKFLSNTSILEIIKNSFFQSLFKNDQDNLLDKLVQSDTKKKTKYIFDDYFQDEYSDELNSDDFVESYEDLVYFSESQ